MATPLFGYDYSIFSWMVVPGFTFAAYNTLDAILCRAMPAGYRANGWLMVAENAALAALLFHLIGLLNVENPTIIFALAFTLKLGIATAGLVVARLVRPGRLPAPLPRIGISVTLRSLGTACIAVFLEAGWPAFSPVDHIFGTLIFWDLAAWLAIVIGYRTILAPRLGLSLWTGSPTASAIETAALTAITFAVLLADLTAFFPDDRDELGIVLWFTFLRTLITSTSLVLQWKFSRPPNPVSLWIEAVFVVGRAAVGACAVQLLLHYLV